VGKETGKNNRQSQEVNNFSFGFTAAALLYRDSVLLAQLFLEYRNWDQVKQAVLKDNLLQIRTIAAQQRIYSEAYTRVKQLSEATMEILANGNREEQCQIIWYAICSKYDFIREFALEVLAEKVKRHELEITKADFNLFFNTKSELHEKLSNISEGSRKKLQTNLFRMLLSSGITDADMKLRLLIVSSRVRDLIIREGILSPAIFPSVVMGY
jgi:hypothetical protein